MKLPALTLAFRPDAPRPAPIFGLILEKLPFFLCHWPRAGHVVVQRRGGAVATVESLPLGLRAANAVVAYVRYLGHGLWPAGLAVFYPYQAWGWETVLGAGVLLAGVTGVVVWLGRRQPPLLVGWVWYLATLLPVIGLVQVGDQSLADRYTYVPLIGLFILAAWGLPGGVTAQRMGKLGVTVAVVGVLGVCAVLSAGQVRYWRNSETLFRHALNVTTGSTKCALQSGQCAGRPGQACRGSHRVPSRAANLA